MYDIMIWAGALLTLGGLALLVYCIRRVAKARKSASADAQLRSALEAIVPVNLAALFLSAVGLMMVVLGIVLG